MNTTETKDFLTSHSYELYESTTMPFTNKTISHFALTDSLLHYVGKYKKIVCIFGQRRIWLS
ncbi:hypothetical protein LHA31_05665 [Carnobacterium viridans]|uniref:hypothetical protein n=1 Tax=Carnobacterium viridans TaxID=174587 RepID=UPI001CFFE3E5|nr:hypothetical protein [Carnobacterium viridans]UDE96182.1 hypothetical protein LHA31_05665 [Carnobacterium viridans]